MTIEEVVFSETFICTDRSEVPVLFLLIRRVYPMSTACSSMILTIYIKTVRGKRERQREKEKETDRCKTSRAKVLPQL